MKIRIPVALLLAVLSAGDCRRSAGTRRARRPSTAAPSQEPPPPPVTFRVEVNYVEVDAVVTDAQGRVGHRPHAGRLRGARGRPAAEDHGVLAGQPADRACRAAALPAAQPIEPDVQANTVAEGRIYLIVLDDLHIDFTNTPRVKRFLREFIEQNFGTNDLAAVVYTERPRRRRARSSPTTGGCCSRRSTVRGPAAAFGSARD